MNNKINLHIHTTHSDGGNTPAEIIAMLKDVGVTTFSITDHNTVDGNMEAAALAKEHGLTHINGIELSCSFAGGEIGLDESWIIHILGYGFDLDLMRNKLAQLENKPTIKDGIGIIHECGGFAVWAHPFCVYRGGKKELTEEQAYTLLFVLIHYSIDGVEAYYQHHTPGQIKWLSNHADTYGLYKTVGTDYHNAQVDLSMFPEYVDLGSRDILAFNAATPDSRAGAIIRRITGINEGGYCDKCPHFSFDSDFQCGAHFWAVCRKLKAGRSKQYLAYSVTYFPSYVECPDWCPLLKEEIEMISFNGFSKKILICPKCDWQGNGKSTTIGTWLEPHCIDVLCPGCYEILDTRAIPTIEDRINLGKTEGEAKRLHGGIPETIAKNMQFYSCLPDIKDDEIIISLHEEVALPDSNSADIVLSWKGKEFWREGRGFEYYTRYLDIGIYLKKKYGERLVDFECEYTWALGGDMGSAFDEVRKFRKILSNKSSMSNKEFDFITKSGIFSKHKATYWKAIEFAKERHAGQTRDEGTPYFGHILGVVETLRKHGHISDYLFTLAALHDILEDTETTKEELYELLRKVPGPDTVKINMRIYDCDESEAVEKYDNLNNEEARNMVKEVELLTHKDGVSFKEHIDGVFQDDSIQREGWLLGLTAMKNRAKYVKLADRIHNLSTLSLCGKPEKIQRKVRETENFIMPWRDKHTECESLFAQIEKQLKELKNEFT